MPPAARITDMHVCPMVTGIVPHVGGPILPPGCPTVLIGYLPSARATDMATCVGPPDTILMGSPTVLIGNLMAARIGDPTVHGGVIVLGCFTVIIGEAGAPAPSAPPAPLPPSVPSAPSPAPPSLLPSTEILPVTPEDRALANSPGTSVEKRWARARIVRSFYDGKPGLGDKRAGQDMKGIDLDQPVEVVDIPPPTTMTQYVRKSTDSPGNFFDPLGTQSGDQLGLNDDPKIREKRIFDTPNEVPKCQALKSTAAPIVDDWTDRKHPVQTHGGGAQMAVDSDTLAKFKAA